MKKLILLVSAIAFASVCHAQAANVKATVTFDPSIPAGEEYIVESKNSAGEFVQVARAQKSPIIFDLAPITRPGSYTSEIRVKAVWKSANGSPETYSPVSNVASTTYKFDAVAPVLKSVTSTISP